MLRKLNLQFFAESGEGEVVETTSTTGEAAPSEKDPNKAWAARLGHERKKIEQTYSPYKAAIEKQAQAAGQDPETYLKSLAEQELADEAASVGKTPEQLKAEREAAESKAKLEALERKEALSAEEKALTSDPKIGKFVTDNLKEIREIADKANCSLDVALALHVKNKLPELMDLMNPETHIKNYVEKLKGGQRPVEIGGASAVPTGTAPKTFEEARAASAEILKASFGK